MTVDAPGVPRTADEARAIGARRYLGRPCGNGHEGWRYVTHDDCCQCARERVRRQKDGLAVPRLVGHASAVPAVVRMAPAPVIASPTRNRFQRPEWFVEDLNPRARR